MKQCFKRSRFSLFVFVPLLLLAFFVTTPNQLWSQSSLWTSAANSRVMDDLYQRLTQLDGYHFSSTVVQTIHPLATIDNIGLSSQTESMLVNGSIDKLENLTLLDILEQDGYLLDGRGQIELKIQDGEIMGRIAGQPWKLLDETATPDQTANEPAAFLQATRNVRLLGTDEWAGQQFQRYAFELDGPAWARIMQLELQEEMRRRGELAPGQLLDSLTYYEEMTGEGELWVNELGLPQRVTIHAVYPPLPNEANYREIQVTSDYSEWQGLADGESAALLLPDWQHLQTEMFQSLPNTPAEAAGVTLSALVMGLLFLVPLALLLYRRSPNLYRTTALAIVALMLVEPLLHTHVVQAASQQREVRSQGVLNQQAENNRVQEAVDQIKEDFATEFDVTQGLIAQQAEAANAADALAATSSLNLGEASRGGNATGIDTDGDNLSDAKEDELKTNKNNKDSDGDGIEDGVEYLTLGLDPTSPDTDGDLISDGVELAGIEMGGKTWYLDPRSKDSNGDSIIDTLECGQKIDITVDAKGKSTKGAPKGNNTCDDTDGDGIPDFADDDNDNDLVWDWLDGQSESRFGDLTTGVQDKDNKSAFVYKVDNYSAGKPLRVTFELRPTNPQHLWYSRNVLDWPADDRNGQIQRVHDTKLGTTGSEANGDMQLVPLVEITIPAADAIHLPTIAGKQPVVGDNSNLAQWLDMDVMQRYQMVATWTPDKQSMQIHIPATLIRDTKGNAPLNFVGKLLYWPNGTGLFSTNHQARLVWMVQMDTDRCVIPDGSTYAKSCLPKGENYQNGLHWKTAKRQLVHRYYDSFYLNAFTAEEDLGNSAHIFYEKPDQIGDKAKYVPDQLLTFGTMIDTYLRRKVSPADALQAYQAKKTKMADRLAVTPVVQDPDVYGLVAKMATQTTPQLLDSTFATHKSDLKHPTLLYVTQSKSKVYGLQGIQTGNALTLDMSQGVLKEGRNIRLGAFEHVANPGTINGQAQPNWKSVGPAAVWKDSLQAKSIAAYGGLAQSAKQKFSQQDFQTITASMYYNLARSISSTNAIAPEPDQANDLIDNLGAAFDNVGENAIGAVMDSLSGLKEAQEALDEEGAIVSINSLFGDTTAAFDELSDEVSDAARSKKFDVGGSVLAGLSAFVSVTLVLQDELGFGDGFAAGLELAQASIDLALSVVQTLKDFQSFKDFTKAFTSVKFESAGAIASAAAIIVAVIILVTAFVMFFKLRADGNPIAAKTALAQGVSGALVVLFFFAIGLFVPVGTAISAILALVDGLIALICKIGNVASDENDDGESFEDRNGWCNGVAGTITAAVAGFFYNAHPMVDLQYKERLSLGQTDTKLVSQNGLLGMSEGNKLQVTQPVTVTVRLPDVHTLNPTTDLGLTQHPGKIAINDDANAMMTVAEYERLIKEKAKFNYQIVLSKTTARDTGLSERATAGDWKSIGSTDSRDQLRKTERVVGEVALQPGVNWTPELYLREYYMIPMAECGVFAGGCDFQFDHFDKTQDNFEQFEAANAAENKGDIDIGKNLFFDVFPQTLSAFYTLEQVQENDQFVNRYRLAWGGTKPFPTLVDADGDGLRSDGTGNLDPDDKTGDKDGDGLPDPFEVQDFRLNPDKADSDDDGLSDYDEIRYGTHPHLADSDNDGLNDGDEIKGWAFVYVDSTNTSMTTWVTSNPRSFDTDGDGLSDNQERVLGFHPRARTTETSVLSIKTTTNRSQSTYLGPSQTIAFTSTVKNELRKPTAYGLLEAEILSTDSNINPATFVLQPQQEQAIKGTIAVPATAPAQNADEITLRNRAGANMVDPSATYASQLLGLAPQNPLKFQLNFAQRTGDSTNFKDATGTATLTCAGSDCPSIIQQSNAFGSFRAEQWYRVAGDRLAFSQPAFSVGGWVTYHKAFGDEYDERVIFGPDNVSGAVEKYLQLSLVGVKSASAQAKIHFTATDGAVCSQVLSGLTVPRDQRTHVFVTYDGTQVHAYKNGEKVGSYNLQGCANKTPAGNRFTIGRGASEATLYLHNVYFKEIDEGGRFNSGEGYLYWKKDSNKILWGVKSDVDNGETFNIGRKFALRTASEADLSRDIYVCEDDGGSRCGPGDDGDDDDYHGTVTVNSRKNGYQDVRWSSSEGSGQLRYNVQNNFFYGDLDDLRIYGDKLSDMDVRKLINGADIHYQLDEAAGRDTFRNAGTDPVQLACLDKSKCPTSGVIGYAGQSVRFTGVDGQALQVQKIAQRFGSNLLTSFWLKPESGAAPATISLLRTGQGTQGFTLDATPQGGNLSLNLRFNGPSTSPAVGATTIPLDQWSHLSIVQAGGELRLYVNGAVQQSTTYAGTGSLYQLNDASIPQFIIGNSFKGLIDEIQLQGSVGSSEGRLQSQRLGGNGGTPFADISCQTNEALVGVHGKGGSSMDSIGIVCAPLNASGEWAGDSVRRGKAGGNGGSAYEQICPRNQAISGFGGSYWRTLVDQVKIICSPTRPGGYVDLTVQNTKSPVGGNGNGATEITPILCPANLAANGIYGRSGSLIDQFGLWCGVPASQKKLLDNQLAAQAKQLYEESAYVYLPFNEVAGSTTFVNATGNANLTCVDAANCPTAGSDGRVRESVFFNKPSTAPSLTVADHRHNGFSFSLWAKVASLPSGSAALVSLHENSGSDTARWRLQLTNSSGKIVPQLVGFNSDNGESCTDAFTITPGNATLVPNQWVHLGVSYDTANGRNHLSLYLNGQLIHEERRSSLICRAGTALRFGQNFTGQMDEFSYYRKPIELTEFLSQYVYQNTWYDELTTKKFAVDYDKPTVKVTANPFVKTGTNIFGVAVSDVKSGIKSVEYKDTDGTWKSATSETATAGVWAFGMNIQGATTLEVRATDNVGNVATDSRSVNIDSTPPSVGLTTSGKQDSLNMSGTASDGESGLQSVSVMVIDPLGRPLETPRNVAVTNGTWQFSSPLPDLINAPFEVYVTAVDQMGNSVEKVVGTVHVDNTPPNSGMLANSLSISGVDSTLPTIRGYVDDRAYPFGAALYVGFEDQGSSGPIASALDMTGNQWQAVPASGGSAPAVAVDGTQKHAQFVLGQTLVITNANTSLGALRRFSVDPYSTSLLLRIKPTSASGNQKILHHDDLAGFSLMLKGDQVQLRINRAGGDGGPVDKDTGLRVVAGQWQQLIVSMEITPDGKQQVRSWLGSGTNTAVGTTITLTGNELITDSAKPLVIGAATDGYAGGLDDLIIYGFGLTDFEARQIAQAAPSNIKKVEVGFLHRRDKEDESKIVWQEATLTTPNSPTTLWQLQVPAGMEGIYDISVRSIDALDNTGIDVGVWSGVIDTQAPQIALSGTPGAQTCVVQDFSLATSTYTCADANSSAGAATANYATGALPAASLTWNAQWFNDLYQNSTTPQRLYALQQTGRDFTTDNVAESCDSYGNCTKCTVTGNNVAAPACTVYSANAAALLVRAAGVDTGSTVQGATVQGFAVQANAVDDSDLAPTITGPQPFTTTVAYERPDAYAPANPPGAATSTWVTLTESVVLVEDAVLAPTRPFAASYTAANTEIRWGESISATQYYVGWTITETLVISDLTAYGAPGLHTQVLPDRGRYYAHVVAQDGAGQQTATLLGPIYFDGATPASYLEWNEFGPNDPYWLWEEAVTQSDGSYCHLLGFDERAALFSNYTSPRSTPQTLFGTWSDEWLAVHWDGLNLDEQGDLHLYLDTKAGGGIYAHNPYSDMASAQGLVTMPERRQYQADTTDRMLADYGVIIEDGETIKFLAWDGTAWQEESAAPLRFQYQDGRAIVWFPLATLGLNATVVDPTVMDASLVGFITEEDAMQVWATMPGNNPLNSPSMLPEHAASAYPVEEVLVNLRTAMRLSSDSAVNNTLDNCPTNVLFEASVLDVDFMADPSGELYDEVVYEGIGAAIPDDVEPVLTSLCAGVDATNSPVCQLAQQLANGVGGGGPEPGPTGSLPTTVGPGDEVVFYATVRNLSNQLSGGILLDIEGDLSSSGTTLNVGILEPLETRVISFTETMGGGSDLVAMTIYPVEEVDNVDENIILSYEHPPQTVLHDVDVAPPSGAEMTTLTISNTVSDDTIGVGLQTLTGLIFDTSLVDELTLQTSLGKSVVCDDTLQINAFTSDFICDIDVPFDTPDGTVVDVTIASATDIYGHQSGALGTWQFTVDNMEPLLELFDDEVVTAAAVNSTSPTTETLVLDGLVGDNRLVDAVEVCGQLDGVERCQDAELYFFNDEAVDEVSAQAAFGGASADEAYWIYETEIEQGIEAVAPYTVTAFDAYGNGTQISFELEIDTQPAELALDATPVTQIGFDEEFALSGTASDSSGVETVELEVLTPLGTYVYYTATLDAAGATNVTWQYAPPAGSDAFAAPGTYSYFILAYDGFGNESELGPYELTIDAPPPALVNAPEFVEIPNLWANFGPGATLSMTVLIDDADIELGDTISVTVEPLHPWLAVERVDERAFTIAGTVPMTITGVYTETVTELGGKDTAIAESATAEGKTVEAFDEAAAQRKAEAEADGLVSASALAFAMTLEDSTGRQAFAQVEYTGETGSRNVGPTKLYFPALFGLGDPNQEPPANQQPPAREVGEPALYLPAFVQ